MQNATFSQALQTVAGNLPRADELELEELLQALSRHFEVIQVLNGKQDEELVSCAVLCSEARKAMERYIVNQNKRRKEIQECQAKRKLAPKKR